MATRPLPAEPDPRATTAGAEQRAPETQHSRPPRRPEIGSARTVFVEDVAGTLFAEDVSGPSPPAGFRLTRYLAFALLGVLAALLLAAAAIWLAGRDDSRPETSAEAERPLAPETTPPRAAPEPVVPPPTMPDVVGLRLPAARATLDRQDRSLRVDVRQVESVQPAGEVLRQSLSPGSEISSTATVALTVSTGPERIVAPFVEGVSVDSARNRLAKAGLRPETRLVRSTRRRGTVLAQTPAAGSRLEPNSVVLLDVATKRPSEPAARPPASSSPPPETSPRPPQAAPSPPVVSPPPPVASPQPRPSIVEVPRLVGSRSADARRRLRALGLQFAVRSVESGQPPGIVVRQSPRAGAQLRKGGTVRLTVSAAPTMIAVPDVIGFDELTAIEQLETAGFEVRIVEQPTDQEAADGVVLDQSPSDEVAAPRGTTVTITVARYQDDD